MKNGKTRENSNPETENINIDQVSSKVNNNVKLFDYILPVISLMLVILLGIFNNLKAIDIARIGILTLITTTVIIYFIKLQGIDLQHKKYAKSIISLSYLLSIILIIQPIHPEILCFWMLGGLLVSMLIDSRLGLLIFINLTFILGVTVSLRPETTIQLLIIGFIMALMSSYLKRKSTVVLASIIVLSTNITISFAINNFVFDSNNNYIISLLSITSVIVCAYFIAVLYERLVLKDMDCNTDSHVDTAASQENSDNNQNDMPLCNLDTRITDDSSNNSNTQNTPQAMDNVLCSDKTSVRTGYDVLLNDNNELLIRLKEYSIPLYEHCRLIADLSGKCARYIGANELLAEAGGLYHEVGKINGPNYIDEGMRLAALYGFPDELTAIIKQHNLNHDRPTSVEASIVMLTDILVSTIKHLNKSGETRYSIDKIIDNILQMRMEKGSLDDSGLTIKDYKLLKEFYSNELNILDKKVKVDKL